MLATFNVDDSLDDTDRRYKVAWRTEEGTATGCWVQCYMSVVSKVSEGRGLAYTSILLRASYYLGLILVHASRQFRAEAGLGRRFEA